MRQLPFDYAFRNLFRSRVRLLASLLGAALVVVLALAAAGFVRGMQQTLTQSAILHENVILLSTGSEESLERSQIDASAAGIISASLPSIREEGGTPFVSPEIHIAIPVRLPDDATDDPGRPAVLRGVRPVALLTHPEVELVEGRFPESGRNEIMIGSLVPRQLGVEDASTLQIGKTVELDRQAWTIVGRFAAPGTVMDAEIWVPLSDLQVATRREGTLSCVIVSLRPDLDAVKAFREVDLFARSRLDLELVAMRETDYYRSLVEFYRPVRIVVIVTAVLIGIGGLLGGLNTMYASFASRVREIGMLQALGFTRPAIVLNLIEESLFVAAGGIIIGLIIGLLVLDGIGIRFSMGAFTIMMDPPVLLVGVLAGLMVGLVGATPPAIRCLRLPVTEALKSF